MVEIRVSREAQHLDGRGVSERMHAFVFNPHSNVLGIAASLKEGYEKAAELAGANVDGEFRYKHVVGVFSNAKATITSHHELHHEHVRNALAALRKYGLGEVMVHHSISKETCMLSDVAREMPNGSGA